MWVEPNLQNPVLQIQVELTGADPGSPPERAIDTQPLIRGAPQLKGHVLRALRRQQRGHPCALTPPCQWQVDDDLAQGKLGVRIGPGGQDLLPAG